LISPKTEPKNRLANLAKAKEKKYDGKSINYQKKVGK